MDNINEAPKTTSHELNGLSLSSLLTPEPAKSSLMGEFGHSFAYQLVQAPVDAVAQMVDGKANGSAREAVHFIDAPAAAQFGTADWVAQQSGQALGAILPILAIHSGVSAALESNYSVKATLAMSENLSVLSGKQQVASVGAKIAESGLTGVVYSGVFTPTATDEQNLWQAKARNAAVGGLTFATLSGSSLGLKSLGESTVASRPALSSLLRSDLASGVMSGVPAGLVSANANSLLSGKGFAGATEQIQSVIGFSTIGGAMGMANSALAEIRPAAHSSEAPASFKAAGVDVDGRPLADSARTSVTAKLPDYSNGELTRCGAQTLKELSEINALESGKNVLDQFRDSNLSISQKYRVLNSLTQVREHFVNQQVNGKIEPDQQGNWIHTQGEFGRVIDAAAREKLTPAQTEDALLASMYSDAVKSKANFFTHHMDGALAADHVLSNQFGGGFDRGRLDGIVYSIREHQIGPPEFMSNLYANRIRAALQFKLSPEQETSLASLQSKMADPLNPRVEKTSAPDGSKILKLSDAEHALLRLSGAQEWYVPDDAQIHNAVSRAVIVGDSVDNYSTPGGIGKIAGLGGPESDKWFMTRRIDNDTAEAERSTNIGSARLSGVDASKLLTPNTSSLASMGQARTEQAISAAKQNIANWLRSEKGIDPDKQPVPFFNADLKYPQFGEADANFWNIHRTPADKRSVEQQNFYDAHRFDGLSTTEVSDFLLAKEMRDRVANDLRAAQRVAGDQPPQYLPAMRPAAKP
jgi:hypothetical protein